MEFTKLVERIGELIIDTNDNRMRFDLSKYHSELENFLPANIIDAHVHLWSPDCLANPISDQRKSITLLGLVDSYSSDNMQLTFQILFPGKKIQGVCFGLVAYEADGEKVNHFVSKERNSVAARLLVPQLNPTVDELERLIREDDFIGFKPYPERIRHIPFEQIRVDNVITKAQWLVANELGLTICLHPPRLNRMADSENLAVLRNNLEYYSNAKIVLAHLGFTACPDHVEENLKILSGYPNLYLDTAMVCDSSLILHAINSFGPQRILYGSDLPFALIRGLRKCINGETVFCTEKQYPFSYTVGIKQTFILYESILALKKAVETASLNSQDINCIFHNNAAFVYQIL